MVLTIETTGSPSSTLEIKTMATERETKSPVSRRRDLKDLEAASRVAKKATRELNVLRNQSRRNLNKSLNRLNRMKKWHRK
jgi:hypothetical protein